MFRLTLILAFLLVLPVAVLAQSGGTPTPPAPVQTLIDEGAQVRYLGKHEGLDGWFTIHKGQEQFFYVTPNGKSIIMGLLFDDTGRLVTMDQLLKLRAAGGSESLERLTQELEQRRQVQRESTQERPFEYRSPSERLYADIERANWVALGNENAPYIYTFIDPQCPYCHSFIQDLRSDYIESGRLQVRMIPVGFHEETMTQAAFLIAASDPESVWFRHMDGDRAALPARGDMSQQGVQRNLAVMQAWQLDVTPLTIYRDRAGEVKILRGRAQDLVGLMADLGN